MNRKAIMTRAWAIFRNGAEWSRYQRETAAFRAELDKLAAIASGKETPLSCL